MSSAAPTTGDATEHQRARLQRLVAVLLVGALPWFVAPGLTQPDTKLDLVLSPGRYLRRALWAWNDHTGVGELQNQAYGYLWPMGPFYWLGDVLGAPGWGVQRAWWALLLVLALLGTERLARRVAGLPTVPALVAGAVYALSPRVLTVLAEISVEVWPYALAPWLVLAADRAVRRGAGRRDRLRAAVTTGLVTACLGGVNATVSLLALVPAAGWIVLAPRGRRRGRALATWLVGAVLGALWWLGPLLVLGRWSYPFLDHIELASTTTAVASVTNVLRGAEHWIAYILTAGDNPTWQSGWVLAQSFVAIVATTAVAALGLAGLVRARSTPDEGVDGDGVDARHLTRWALTGVVLGVIVMVTGREGSASGPLAGPVQQLLDGPLAPLRNVHKADLLVRLPVALGVGMLLHWATRVRGGAPDRLRPVLVAGTVLALVGAVLPIWQGRVGDAWAYRQVPAEWHEMAARVDADAARDGGTTLLLPGARTADHTWGRTGDEPLVALASSPVLVRAAAPLGAPGVTRVLDGLDLLTASGAGSEHLADQLRRLGVARVVVRWGLRPDVGALDPDAVAAGLDASPGLTRAGEVGERDHRVVLWRVDDPAGPVTAYPAATRRVVAGAPEAWPALAGAGLVDPGDATVLTGDAASGRAADGGSAADGVPVVVTDTLRWQALNSGRPPQAGRSPTLVADDDRPATVGTKDLPPGGDEAGRTVREWGGDLASVDVSSSAADPFARLWRSAGTGPAALVDDDPATAWVSGDGAAVQRVTLRLRRAAPVTAVVLRPATGDGLTPLDPSSVAVDGATGTTGTTGTTSTADTTSGGGTVRVALDGSVRDEVTVTLRVATGDADVAVGVADLRLEGADVVGTALRTPDGDGGVLLTRDPRAGADVAAGEDPADLVRTTSLPPGSLEVRAWVRGRPGAPVPGGDGSREEVRLGCGDAGVVRVGDERLPLSLSTTRDALARGAPVEARPCGAVRGAGGTVRVHVEAAAAVVPERVALRPADGQPADGPASDPASEDDPGGAAPARAVTARRDAPGRWRIDVAAGEETYLTLAQGANDGWRARTADGAELEAVTVDGWRQGFVLLEGGAQQVRIDFAPTTAHRSALLAGAFAVVLLLLAALGLRSTAGTTGAAATAPTTDARAPHPPRVVPLGAAIGAAVVAGGLVAGVVGVLAAAAGALVPPRRRAVAVLLALTAAGVAVAVLGAADRQSAGATAGQALGALTLGLVVAALVRPAADAPARARDARAAPTTDGPGRARRR